MHSHARPAVMYLDQPSPNKMYFDGSARASEHAYNPTFKPIAILDRAGGIARDGEYGRHHVSRSCRSVQKHKTILRGGRPPGFTNATHRRNTI
jgi:hypothetical protein